MIEQLIGRSCSSVEKYEFTWAFGFGEAYSLSVECPWRIIVDGRIGLASGDHEQRYGLTEPIDAHVNADALLVGKVITNVVATEAGDMTIKFDDIQIEILNNSSGYEEWVLSLADRIVVGRNG